MVKSLTLVLILFCVKYTFGQDFFEKGYFINDTSKIECLVKNLDWKNNPRKFEYKILDIDFSKSIGIESVKEFGIYSTQTKYVKAIVKIDKSVQEIGTLSKDKNPEWKIDTLFLKAMIDGEASLYFYKSPSKLLFFYKLPDSDFQQLIYKKYLLADGAIAKNNMFRQQLWLDLKCEKINLVELERLSYNKSQLQAVFINYNQCVGKEVVNYLPNSNKKSSPKINVRVTPGFNRSAFSITYSNKDETMNLSTWGLRLGLEFEYIFPGNNKRWAFVFEPTFQSFVSDGLMGNVRTYVKYAAIEFPLGIRYSFINQKPKFYVNAFYNPNLSLDFNSNVRYGMMKIPVYSSPNFALGLGFQSKFASVELRYYTGRDLVFDQPEWQSNYTRIAFILGLRLKDLKRGK